MNFRHPIPRSGKPIKRSTKPIPKVNARRQAKRKAGYRKLLSGKEYRVARREALARARNQCELWLSWTDRSYAAQCPPVPFEYTGTVNATTTHVMRCPVTLAMDALHAHHKRYPKSRPLAASDLTICCKPHHEYLESLKMGKTRMY